MSFRHAARDVTAGELLHIARARSAKRGPIDVAVLVHGLFVDEQNWTLGPDPLESRLRDDFGWAPLLVRFNTGRHISHNGRELADLLVELHEEWGQNLGRVQLIGHSMGGLVARSALAALEARQANVLNHVHRLFLLATPNQGADLERIGHTLEMALRHVQRLPTYGLRLFGGRRTRDESTFARVQSVAALPVRSFRGLIGLRSDGIRDTRYGYMQQREWEMDTAWNKRALVSHKRPLPPPLGVRAYSIAGSLWPNVGATPSRWRNDGLVSVSSAAGKGGDFDDIQVIENNRFVELPMLLHQLLPTSERVRNQMARWIEQE
jgi:pimeloyl-ACP methyl ester carboxylesterase